MISLRRLRSSEHARLFGLLLVTLCVRVPSFVHHLMDTDEAEYGAVACRMLDGGLPYRDGVTIKLPGLLWVYQTVFTLFGRFNMLAVHLATAAVACATALVCRQIARRLAGDHAGWCAAYAYAIFSVGFYSKMQAANTEMFAVLPAALAVWLYLKAEETSRLLVYLAAGALSGVAVVFKQPLALLPLSLVAAGWFEVLRRRRSIASQLAVSLALAVGTSCTLALLVLYLYFRGILDVAVFWTWTYIWRYYFPSVQDSLLIRLVKDPVPFTLAMAPLVVLAVYARAAAQRPVVFWLLGMIVAALAGGRMFGHYFLLTVPPLSVLAGVGATRVWSPQARSLRPLRVAIVSVTALLALGQWIGAIVYEGATDSLFRPKPDYLAAATHLRTNTQSDDRVFVWGWFPALYVEGQRCPSTRFVYAHHLAGKASTDAGQRSHSVPEAWQQVMSDLEGSPPAYILDTSHGDYEFSYAPIERYPQLWSYVSRRYRLETEISGVRFYVRRESGRSADPKE